MENENCEVPIVLRVAASEERHTFGEDMWGRRGNVAGESWRHKCGAVGLPTTLSPPRMLLFNS
jgi:hypothetical protein